VYKQTIFGILEPLPVLQVLRGGLVTILGYDPGGKE
jgi:hypothetical protein